MWVNLNKQPTNQTKIFFILWLHKQVYKKHAAGTAQSYNHISTVTQAWAAHSEAGTQSQGWLTLTLSKHTYHSTINAGGGLGKGWGAAGGRGGGGGGHAYSMLLTLDMGKGRGGG